jgi:hypothetical protein
MGTEGLSRVPVSLVVFTCEGREHLLHQTIKSFTAQCNFKFTKVILAIDGPVSPAIHALVKPDMIIQQYKRQGYVHMISRAIKTIDTPYFFWLEDDWAFKMPVAINGMLESLTGNQNWAQIILSKYGPLEADMKIDPLGNGLYQSTFGFSANPCLCNTKYIKDAFALLASAKKGDTLGEDGFENFLSRYFEKVQIICVIQDPVDGQPISHEGYLETTPRNWHMTNSLDEKTSEHLLTIPLPSFPRRLLMAGKLLKTFFVLATQQLFSNKIYEYCFRVIATSKTINKDE